MWTLYQLALGLALTLAAPPLLLRRGRHYLETIPGRLGRYSCPKMSERPLWLHAVSVGEVGVAATLIGALPDELPLVVTTVTPTGQRRAQALLGNRATVAYLPFDLTFAVQRFLEHFSPRGLILIEGEFWPLLLRSTARAGIPAVLVNGRISDRSFGRMRRIKPLLSPLFSEVARFGVQTGEDRQRLLALGVDGERVTATGNLKYESPDPPPVVDLEDELRRLANGRPILVAGSTMAAEELQLCDAFTRLGGGAHALLIIAPRHPERWDGVATEIERLGLRLQRRSALGAERSSPPPEVFLLDSLGELASVYRIATAAFIGGTLVPSGGHNPLEAARFGKPIAVGPSMENFREMAGHFDRARAWERVHDARELGDVWRRWLEEPDGARAVGARAAATIAKHRGALARTLELLRSVVALEESADVPAGTGAVANRQTSARGDG